MRLVTTSALLASCFTASVLAQNPTTQMAVVREMHIGGPGRWDYVTVDPATHDLWVTRSTHTQVIDSVAGKVVADIPGGERLHGTALVPAIGRAFITDGKSGKVLVADMKSHAMLGTIEAADDADGTIYDPGSDRVLVSCGDAGQLVVLDPHADPLTAKVEKIDLGGKPEFLAADGKGHAFVCLNDKSLIAVVDLKTKAVTERWPMGSGTSPAGLAIDPKNGRLFIGCHNEKAIVMSTADGKVIAEVPIGHGNDACLFDEGTGHAYASCGDGTVTVIGETSPGIFTAIETVKTKPGARTAGLDPDTHTLYLPAAEVLPAENGKRPLAKPDSFSIVVVGMLGRK